MQEMSKQLEIKMLEAKVKQNFYRTPIGRAYKKHLDFFGVPPITYSRGPHGDKSIRAYTKAIETGVPYDERNGMTEEELSMMY
jgi:hypothetical protein